MSEWSAAPANTAATLLMVRSQINSQVNNSQIVARKTPKLRYFIKFLIRRGKKQKPTK